MCKLLDRQAEKHYDQVKKPMNLAIATIRGQEKADREPMGQAIEQLDPKILAWEEEQRRRYEDLRARLQDDARQRAQLARDTQIAEFEKAGNQKAADDLRKQRLFVSEIVLPEFTGWLEGESRTEKWIVQEDAIDLLAVAQAVVDGRLPSNVLAPNLAALNNLARAIKDSGEIPGCKIICEKGIGQR
jgi:hypothetical protein